MHHSSSHRLAPRHRPSTSNELLLIRFYFELLVYHWLLSGFEHLDIELEANGHLMRQPATLLAEKLRLQGVSWQLLSHYALQGVFSDVKKRVAIRIWCHMGGQAACISTRWNRSADDETIWQFDPMGILADSPLPRNPPSESHPYQGEADAPACRRSSGAPPAATPSLLPLTVSPVPPVLPHVSKHVAPVTQPHVPEADRDDPVRRQRCVSSRAHARTESQSSLSGLCDPPSAAEILPARLRRATEPARMFGPTSMIFAVDMNLWFSALSRRPPSVGHLVLGGHPSASISSLDQSSWDITL